MKKIYFILFILFFSASELFAQHSIGIIGGASYSNGRFNPRSESVLTGPFVNAGASYRFRGGDKYLGGLQVDVIHVNMGYKILNIQQPDTSMNRSVKSFEIPFFWHPHVKMGKKKQGVFFLNLGPYIGVTYSSSDITIVSKRDGLLELVPYKFDPIKDNVINYGLMGGVGFGVSIKNIEIVAEVRYVFGFSDIMKNPNKYPDSDFIESPISQIRASIGVYYNFLNPKK